MNLKFGVSIDSIIAIVMMMSSKTHPLGEILDGKMTLYLYDKK